MSLSTLWRFLGTLASSKKEKKKKNGRGRCLIDMYMISPGYTKEIDIQGESTKHFKGLNRMPSLDQIMDVEAHNESKIVSQISKGTVPTPDGRGRGLGRGGYENCLVISICTLCFISVCFGGRESWHGDVVRAGQFGVVGPCPHHHQCSGKRGGPF